MPRVLTNIKPTSGQFIVTWEHDLCMWAETRQYINGLEFQYNELTDAFDLPIPTFTPECLHIQYTYLK